MNPIHLSDERARAAGLEGRVLHGMFIASRFEAFLERVPHGRLTELSVRFVRPAPVGSTLAISARALAFDGAQLHLRLLAHIVGGTLVAIGDARLEWRAGVSG